MTGDGLPHALDAPHGSASGRLRLGQRVGGGMALVGAAVACFGVLTAGLSPGAATVQATLAVVMVACGLALLALPPSRTLMNLVALLGVLVVSTTLASGDDLGTTPFFYLWPAVYAAYFGSRRLLAAVLGTTAVTLVAGLVLMQASVAVVANALVGTLTSVGLVATVVALMRTREARLAAQLRHAAHTDPLTGLLNRRGFDPRFASLVEDCVAQDRAISIVLIDLDHFKRFNDRFGHIVGDEALRRVSGVLLGHAGETDLVARLGGEEYAIAMPGATALEAVAYAERVAWTLGTEAVDPELRLSASAGVGSFVPGDESVSALILRADEALYAAKNGGRARAAWWSDGELVIGGSVDLPAASESTLRPLPPLTGASPVAVGFADRLSA